MGNQRACPDVLAGLGCVAYLQADLVQARAYLRDSLTGFHFVIVPLLKDDHRWATELQQEFLLCLQTCALVEFAEGTLERAVTLLGAADARVRDPVDLGQKARVDDAMNTIRSRLSTEAIANAWTTGQSMSVEAVLDFALRQ